MNEKGNVVFRSMEPEDIGPCADLYRLIYRHYPWRENWKYSTARTRIEEVFGTPHRFAYGAWDGKDLIAFCLGAIITRSDRYSAQISEFGIDPETRYASLGNHLLDYTIAQLAAKGVKSLYTLVLSENPALSMFQKSGFHYSQHYLLLVKRMD